MLVMQNWRGLGDIGPIHPRSRTMACPGARAAVAELQATAGANRLVFAPRGVGTLSDTFASVPTWAWAAGGGLIAGLVAGAVLFKKKG